MATELLTRRERAAPLWPWPRWSPEMHELSMEFPPSTHQCFLMPGQDRPEFRNSHVPQVRYRFRAMTQGPRPRLRPAGSPAAATASPARPSSPPSAAAWSTPWPRWWPRRATPPPRSPTWWNGPACRGARSTSSSPTRRPASWPPTTSAWPWSSAGSSDAVESAPARPGGGAGPLGGGGVPGPPGVRNRLSPGPCRSRS